jgi:hypothetical protein
MHGLARVTVTALACLALTIARLAEAQTTPVEQAAIPVMLEYRAPPTCPSAEAFFEAVRSRTQRVRLAREGEGVRTFVVEILSYEGRTFGSLLVTEGGEQTDSRDVEGADCAEVVEALALTAALSVDPDALLAAPAPAEPEPAPPPPAPPKPKPRKPPPPPPLPPAAPAPPPQPTAQLLLGLAALGAKVLDPYQLVGASAAVQLESLAPAILAPAVRLGGLHARNDLASEPDQALATWSSLALDGCPVRFGSSRLVTLRPCVAVHAGVLYLRGLAVDYPSSATRFWYSVGVLGRADLALGRGLELELQTGLLLPLIERRFFTEVPRQDVAQTPQIAAFLALGLAAGLL